MEYDNNNINSNEIILSSRKKQKEIVRPYRKYQCQLLILIIILCILISILISLNTTLNYNLRELTKVNQKLISEESFKNTLIDLENRLIINYDHLYKLDQNLNIDIIKSLDEMHMIFNFISKQSDISFGLCFKASVHGDKPNVFRQQCHGLSPLLMLVETTDGYRFGGYTTQSFLIGENKAQEDEFAFIFSFDTKKKYKVIKPGKAVSDYDGMFPMFGEGDIYISDNCLQDSTSSTYFPISYEEDTNAPMDYVLNGGVRQFTVKELEIMVVYFNFNSH